MTWLCWGAVALAWVAGWARGRCDPAPVRRRDGPYAASLVAAIAGVAIAVSPASVWQGLTSGSPWLRAAGVAILLPATAGALWARGALGSMWSAAAVVRRDHELRTSGPYAITRHPIYTAILVMLAGTALTQGLGRWLGLLVAVALALLAKASSEERLLSEQFPQQYARYRQEVPRLIPRPHFQGRRAA